jgi:acyl phosphate:glycerol-3-phosphate acyltransferase
VAVVAVAYLAGATPWSQILARRRGVDLRYVDGGTVSGTALYRVAGFAPLAVAGCLDVAKGAVGPVLASRTGARRGRPLLAAAASAAAVVGHDWSVFLCGAGGRGIAPALGALAVGAPAGAAVLLAGLGVGRVLRATALGCLVAEVALVPVTARLHGRHAAVVSASVVAPMLLKRLVGNQRPATWERRTVAHRLLFDREPPPAPPIGPAIGATA